MGTGPGSTSDTQPSKRKKHSAMCVGCGGQIHDQFILRVAPDLTWHASCLKCADCDQYLDETCTCFLRDGKTYCKRDYIRLFGTKCAKCGNGFCKNDFVMRARNKIFHIDCFRCVACSRQLIPGDEFALRDDGLFCKADHEVVERATNTPNGSKSENSDSGVGSPSNNNNNETKPNIHAAGQGEPMSGSRSGRIGHVHKGGERDHKPTRVRTVLNEKQLHTLRTCYAANPRPDALMKEQLVEMTGLCPRVIRVWFQNKRCKDKKRQIQIKAMQHADKMAYCMPQLALDEENGSLQRPLQGVPMVASSPVRHESNLQANPVEVQSYQPPWKALSEFAMQSDLDQPPFQQLVNSFDNDSMGYMAEMHDDGLHPPNSVSSDGGIPGTPSELSSPMSSQ